MPLILTPTTPSVTPGSLRWELLDVGGVLRDLTYDTSPALFVSRGASGLGFPPAEPVLEKLPFSPGSVLRYTRTMPREIHLPIAVSGASMAAVMTAVETLASWIDDASETARRPAYLRITRPQDGTERQIACYRTGGLEGDLDHGGPTFAPLVLSLICPNPFFTDIGETEVVYDQSDTGTPLAVLNAGDAIAYPVWTINGPASAITLTNQTTGKALALTASGGLSLASGDALTIDTRPTDQREGLQVTNQDGLNLFNYIAAGSGLWWLEPGSNTFQIDLSGATSDTQITLSWLSRYRGVLR